MIRKNSVHPLEITDLNNLGFGVGRIDNMVCFVADGVPGDEGDVKIIKAASSYLVGKWEKIRTHSPQRTADRCPAFPRCGGCAFCHVNYETEKEIKTDFVLDLLRKSDLAHIQVKGLDDKLPAAGYRNKAPIPIAADSRGRAYAGFYALNSHRAIPAESCMLHPAIFSEITRKFVDFLNENGVAPYEEESDRGVVRHLYLRSARNHSAVMICPILRRLDGFPVEKFKAFAEGVSPAVESVYLNLQPELNNVVLGDRCIHLAGKPILKDSLCGLDFEISPLSFYQINHDCAEKIYRRAAELARLQSGDVLVDFYCGTGTIGLSMARQVKELYGIEIVPDAVANARENARINGIGNARFLCADAKEGVEQLLKEGVRPTVAVIDPPRKGTTEEFIGLFSRIGCERLIYISCNPVTLVRDLKLLEERGYAADTVELYDMFPRTKHVETVVLMTRNGAEKG